MSGISALYILDHKGRVLITRAYRADVPYNIHEKFNQKLIENDEMSIKPVFVDNDGTSFFYTRVNNLMFLAVSKRNSNASLVFTFLFRFISVLTTYFKELEEESIRDNFVVIYELLDEMMDNGYPQTTEFKILSEFIKNEKYELNKKEKKSVFDETKLPSAISNAQSWRPEGLSYKKNEVFLDVIERVNMLISPNSTVIKSEVLGALKMKCYLSNMPELKLGLNDKVLFELQGRATKKKAVDLNDIKFHQCVKLTKFENERVISFVPPDGEFELISYRLDVAVKPLFMVEVQVKNLSKTRLEFFVTVKSNYKAKCLANNVEIYIPVPSDSHSPSFRILNAADGTCTYIPDKDCVMWNIKQFAGHKEKSMFINLALPTVVSPEREKYLKTPIQIEFEIPYFTVSGIQVRYLKITDKTGYQAYPWVRYISRNGEYQIRMK